MLKLESGMDYGTGPNGEKICRGAKMGRPDIIPPCLFEAGAEPVKLHLQRLKWTDHDYDQGGAYWGHSNDPKEEASKDVYLAWGKWSDNLVFVQVFVRARNRKTAKALVRGKIRNAKFFH